MAERILVDVAEMQDAISKYDTAKNTQKDAVTAMQSAIDNIEWTGSASQTFAERFKALKTNLDKSELIMDDAISELRQVMNIMQQAESNVGTTAGAIDPGPSEMPI